MSKLNLKDIDWKIHTFSEVFNIYTGKNIKKEMLKNGKIPRVTAKDTNNGIDSFHQSHQNSSRREFTNFISISFLGSVFYQLHKSSLDMKIHCIKPKDIELNSYTGLFICNLCKSQFSKFSYGNQLSSKDLAKQKILLPIGSENKPDFKYMESYAKDLKKQKEQAYFTYITERVKCLKDITKPLKLEEKDWGAFLIESIAQITSGKDIYDAERVIGDMPYISSTANQNGIGYFVGNTNTTLEKGCISVNRNGSVGYSFYHPYKALFSNDCRKLRPCQNSRYIGLFLSNQITWQREKYGYGYKMGTARLKKQKIMLPINKDHQPDYEYMEHYMKYLEYKKLKAYLDFKKINN